VWISVFLIPLNVWEKEEPNYNVYLHEKDKDKDRFPIQIQKKFYQIS
jgi:hypothetical protein